MIRFFAFLALILCIIWIYFAGQMMGQCPGCCCGPITTGGATNDLHLAQGCYAGDGTADRTITTNLKNPGYLFISRKTTSAVGGTSYYHIPSMGDNFACTAKFSSSPAQCTTGRILKVEDNDFHIDNDQFVNAIGQNYCWYEWQAGDTHDTFVYTGDGNSTQTISTGRGTTPTFAMVQIDSAASTGRKGYFYARSKDMPTNTSYGWYTVGEAGQVDIVMDFGPGTIKVGSQANQLNKTYRGFWFSDKTGYGNVVKWTGNGNNAGSANCAFGTDRQDVANGCTVYNVISTGCNTVDCDGASCAVHSGVQACIRGTNIGLGVAGPGGISADDFYCQGPYGNDSGNQQCYIGNLGGNLFTAAGCTSFAHSLNDNGQTNYAWLTCATPP